MEGGKELLLQDNLRYKTSKLYFGSVHYDRIYYLFSAQRLFRLRGKLESGANPLSRNCLVPRFGTRSLPPVRVYAGRLLLSGFVPHWETMYHDVCVCMHAAHLVEMWTQTMSAPAVPIHYPATLASRGRPSPGTGRTAPSLLPLLSPSSFGRLVE